ncbi:MAG TPA: M48 family metalloprotease [Solirubrobacteraceae bacterium]|jgi:Zn-dependent protease with chaperone function
MPSFLRTARDHALVIFERERPFFTPGALSMYIFALVAEAPVIIARYLLALLAVFAVLVIEGNPHGGTEWALLALVPTAWSTVALLNPTGGAWWWQTRAGGREPSKREQLAYDDAVELLQANAATPLPLPKHWFVIDSPQPDAAVCGDALMLSRGLLETDHLPAVLAHELGHLASPDARLTAAINRLIVLSTPFRAGAAAGRSRPQMELVPRLQYTPQEDTNVFDLEPGLIQALFGFLRFLFIASLFAKGGLGLWLTGPFWGRYWRSREYHADQYAARLGQADELADFLEIHALIHDNPIPFLWLTEHTHPPTELRIDRLRARAPATTEAATDAEPEVAPEAAA